MRARRIAGDLGRDSRTISVSVAAARVANLLGYVRWKPSGEPVEAVVQELVLIEKIDPDLSSLLLELQAER